MHGIKLLKRLKIKLNPRSGREVFNLNSEVLAMATQHALRTLKPYAVLWQMWQGSNKMLTRSFA